jgi:hypothetical protein
MLLLSRRTSSAIRTHAHKGVDILDETMDDAKRQNLVERIKMLGLCCSDRPLPLVTLEEFFVGNDDFGSIGCNLTPMLGPQMFFERLNSIRSQPNVQDVFVEISEVAEDPTTWPFADRVYILTSGTPDEIKRWTADLQPDSIQEGLLYGKPFSVPELRPGFKCYGVWWD